MSDELSTLLASMTPDERARYDTIQQAVAAGVLTANERVTLNRRVNDVAWVNQVRQRLTAQKSTKVSRLQ